MEYKYNFVSRLTGLGPTVKGTRDRGLRRNTATRLDLDATTLESRQCLSEDKSNASRCASALALILLPPTGLYSNFKI